jgi:hypothetical protein
MSYTDICLQTGADSGAILPANGHGDREYGQADEVAHGTGEVGVDVALEDVSGEEEGARHAAREQCKPLLMLESGRRCMHRRPQLLFPTMLEKQPSQIPPCCARGGRVQAP